MERYTQIKILGKGSFGSAWLISRNEDKAQFVAKEVRLQGLKPAERESAKHEIDMLRTLNHPNITRYVDHFEHRGSLYIVMEYANGGDLYVKIKQRRGQLFSEREVLHYFSQICLALNYLHERRILHRDLKSQNVFLTRDGIVKLGDFGISTVLRNTYELKRTVCGTPYYFSPELCLNKPYNNKSDVWALGCILYEMSTLNHAFDGNNMKALVQKILKGVYPPINATYSPDLGKLISAMLQIDPQRRPNVSQIIELPFMRNSLASLQQQVHVAKERRLSVVPAEEKQKMQEEAMRRQQEYRQREQDNAAKLALQRQQHRVMLEQKQRENEERHRRLRERQMQQEEELRARKKELEDRVREQRKLQEQRAKAAANNHKRREEEWNANMQRQAHENELRRQEEQRLAVEFQQQQQMRRQMQHQQQQQQQQQQNNGAAEMYREMRRQAAMNKQRVQDELGRPPAQLNLPPDQPPPPRTPPTADHYSSRHMTQEELEEARAAAYWQMRREAENNRRKLQGKPPLEPKPAGSAQASPYSSPHLNASPVSPPPQDGAASPSFSQQQQQQASPSPPVAVSEAESPNPIDADGEEGYREFLNGEAVAGDAGDTAAEAEQRDKDYGALATAIGQVLTQRPKGSSEDFDDVAFNDGDPTKFVLDGMTLEMPNVSATDPLMHRIESLRLFLEDRMGEDALMACYKAMNSISAEDDDAMQRVADALPPNKQRFLPLVAQLIVCEDMFNNMAR